MEAPPPYPLNLSSPLHNQCLHHTVTDHWKSMKSSYIRTIVNAVVLHPLTAAFLLPTPSISSARLSASRDSHSSLIPFSNLSKRLANCSLSTCFAAFLNSFVTLHPLALASSFSLSPRPWSWSLMWSASHAPALTTSTLNLRNTSLSPSSSIPSSPFQSALGYTDFHVIVKASPRGSESQICPI